MNNKVILENPKRRQLKIAIIALLLFAVMFTVTLFLLRAINTSNLNGNVRKVTGTVSEIVYDETAQIVFDDGSSYNASLCETLYDCDLDLLVGKNIELYLPNNQFGNGLPFVLGIVVQGETLIDYNQTIATETESNTVGMIVCGVIAGILGISAIALLVWRLYIPDTKEFPLAEKYSEYSLERQPRCPEYRTFLLFVLIGLSVIMAICVADAIVCTIVDSDLVAIVLSIVTASAIVGYTVAIFPLRLWLAKKELDFYAKNFPFDFADVSHVRMRKSFKEQLQQMVESERKLYPHRYGDGGNGYEIDFTAHGADFYVIYDDDFEREQSTPTAENVFGLDEHKRQPRFTLTYAQLNFEAVAIYRKYDHPLTVVIKSRLTSDDTLPSKMINDVHIILDVNLLNTLQTFNVEVANLQYLLDNKERLMKENCKEQKR